MSNYLYARVSSAQQNLDRQLEDKNKYDDTYEDKCSGKDRKRPKLEELLSVLKPGDVVTCHSLDRLARNIKDLLDLVKEITDKDCTIIFLKENLKFEPSKENFTGQLMLSILGAIAEFERALLKARQMEGIKIAKEKHRFKGSEKRLCNHDASELKRLVATKEISIKDAMKKYRLSRASVYNYLKR